jgi:hypothetical protein
MLLRLLKNAVRTVVDTAKGLAAFLRNTRDAIKEALLDLLYILADYTGTTKYLNDAIMWYNSLSKTEKWILWGVITAIFLIPTILTCVYGSSGVIAVSVIIKIMTLGIPVL